MSPKPEVSDTKGFAEDAYRQREEALVYQAALTGDPAIVTLTKNDDAVRQRYINRCTGGKSFSTATSVGTVWLCDRSWIGGPKTDKNRGATEEVQAVIEATVYAVYPQLPDLSVRSVVAMVLEMRAKEVALESR